MPRWVKDIEANYKAQVVDWNFVGKYTVPSLKFTKEALVEARSYYGEGGKADYVSDQILEKDKDLLRTVNKLLLNQYDWEDITSHRRGVKRNKFR
jgi:asparagine synthetase A